MEPSALNTLEQDRRWMKRALREAEHAYDAGEVPVGAIVVYQDSIVGRGHNMVEKLNDPTAHAEILAVTAACDTLKSKVLAGCTLYVTLEPCPMCAGALVLSKIPRVVFGALDPKAGSASTLYNILNDQRLNHQVEVLSGIEEEASAELLKNFFREKRKEL